MSWLRSILQALLQFMFDFSHHWWLAIILFGIAVRMVLYPLMRMQLKSQMSMVALQPEVDKIKKRFKGDPTRENQETLELWRKYKVNPMAGCLLLLVQMPIWWALYQMLGSTAVMDLFRGSSTSTFLYWNLAQPDKYYIFPILSAVSTYFMSMTMNTGQPSQPNMKMMNYMTPVLMLMISIRYSVAFSLYFLVNNGLQILQQVLTPKPKFNSEEAS